MVGVDERLMTEFSQRRNAIEDRFDDLRAQYRLEHGHEPSKATQHQAGAAGHARHPRAQGRAWRAWGRSGPSGFHAPPR
nr:relaxase domain-containing protein [Nocardioides convexus]